MLAPDHSPVRIGIMLSSLFALLLTSVFAAAPSHCRIAITFSLHSGETRESFFYVKAKDKKDCQKEAERHRTNFMPELLKDKTVKAEWLEPAA